MDQPVHQVFANLFRDLVVVDGFLFRPRLKWHRQRIPLDSVVHLMESESETCGLECAVLAWLFSLSEQLVD